MHNRLQISLFCGFLFLLSITSHAARADEDWNVLSKGSDQLLYESLLEKSSKRYAKRTREIEATLQNPETARQRGERLLRDYRRIVG